MSSSPLFYSLFLSLSHLSHFHLPLTSSSPTLSPPCLSISLNSSSPIGFSTLCLFIFHGVFPDLFTSPIDCTLNLLFGYLNSPLPTVPTVGDAALRNFFYSLCFYGGLCMKNEICFPLLLFDSIYGFFGICYY